LMPLEKLQEYQGSDFSFRYILAQFDSINRIVDRYNGKWVTALDGRPVWGTDGNFPKTRVADIDIKINGQKIVIHKVFYSDIFECDNRFSVYKSGRTFFVHQWNGDGAGAYELVWVFDEKGLKQRL